ncbi:MAG: adenylate/guanylate cyclase domain-containing protein [Dongiaceae bacterium]
MERKLAAILAADVVGYAALMERDEKGTHERLTAGRKELFEPEIARHHGRIFKLMGDGMLAEFGSVVDAVECAVSLQRGLAERNANVPEDRRVQVRIGINLGEVIVEGDDRYGEGVNIAARLEQLADPGGICVSAKVAREVEKKLAFGFEPMGAQQVKNIAEPVLAFRVKLDGMPVKRMAPVSPKRALPWAAALAAVAAVAAIWFAVLKPADAPTPSATVPSIAVLPFDNIGSEETLTYFGDGVAEDIISMLARAPDLSVIARNSSFTYRGKATDVRQIGKELGVGYVLEGSVRKDADKVRIVAQLIDAKTGEHVWAERFDKTGTDPWSLQDEVTGKIIGALTGEKGQLKRAQYREAWGKDGSNLEEYDFYLRGHDRFMSWTPEGMEDAGRIWSEGLRQYPKSGLLRIKLGFYHYTRAYSGWSQGADADYRQAGELVREGFRGPNLSPLARRLGHWLFAYVAAQERDFARAVSEANTAASLAPYDAFMLGDLSQILIMAGQPDQAIDWASKALINDPAMTWNYNGLRGWAYETQGKYEESLAALKLSKTDIFINLPLLMVIDLVNLNRLDEAKTMLAKALTLDSTFTQAKWRDITFYSDMSIVDREVAALAKAGLPEK